MALVLKVEKSSISADCGTLTVVDSTGNYNNPDNLGGYGAPNETRANLYLQLLITLKKTDGDEQITVPAVNENTVSTWSITITEDGHYELFLFGTLAWSAAVTYETDYVIYDASSDKFYKSIQDSNLNNAVTDTDWWAVADDPDDFLAAVNASQPDTYNDIENIIELCNSVVCKNAAILSETKCNCLDKCLVKDYEKLRSLVEAATIHEAQGTYSQGQTIVERMQEICAEIECNTCNDC